ncbi:unnamed protein product [Rotaria magnacalcarata]|uniref:Uncharacterized protein n=1 Tax=Rotaria magnacalcarata TaxID=392030 RepID=A0A816YVD8_9BILA|nr:unnamed protein product [Rotaria magnacalcarata]
MDEYQDIDNIGEFYDYVTNTWIDNDPLFDSALSRHLKTGALPPRKKLFANRNARLQNLEERFKQKTLTLDEYLTKVSQLIGMKKY